MVLCLVWPVKETSEVQEMGEGAVGMRVMGDPRQCSCLEDSLPGPGLPRGKEA